MPLNTDVVPESTYIVDYQQSTRALWLGLLSGPFIYALYFITGYLLSEASCRLPELGVQPVNLASAIGVLTGAATLLGIAATLYEYRLWQNNREREDSVGQALNFLATGGLLLSLLFTLMIVVTGISVFFLDVCNWV